MRKLTAAITVILLAAAVCAAPAQAETKKRFSIGTAGTAGALYPMGVAMGQVITKHAPGLAATGEATAASVENLRSLSTGKMWMGIAANEIAAMAYNGEGDFAKRKMDNIRAMFATIYSYVQIFVKSDSPINSVADFKGKTVGVGPAGSGGEMSARMTLAYYGLTYNDLKPQFIPETEAVQALKDGRIDGFICTHPIKSAALLDLTNAMTVKMLALSDPAFYAKYPFYAKHTIPAGTYKGVDVDVDVPISRIIMFTTTKADFTTEDVYQIMKAIWDHQDEWNGVHAAVKKQVVLETALNEIPVPLHPGAIRFFEEKGMQVDPRLHPPEYKQ